MAAKERKERKETAAANLCGTSTGAGIEFRLSARIRKLGRPLGNSLCSLRSFAALSPRSSDFRTACEAERLNSVSRERAQRTQRGGAAMADGRWQMANGK